MPVLELKVATGAVLSVRRFVVREAISRPFEVTIVARCEDPSLDLDAILDQPARFHLVTGMAGAAHKGRTWTGICRLAEQDRVEPRGLSTYRFQIVPRLWLMSQSRAYRIFQHQTAPEIAASLLSRWGVEHRLALGPHPRLAYKVQYGESDYAFFCRILEEAGIAFTFPEGDDGQARLSLADALHRGEPRPGPITYVASPNEAAERELVTEVRLSDETRPGAYVIRDHDLRRPDFRLLAEAERAPAPEALLEEYQYRHGAFLIDKPRSGLVAQGVDKKVDDDTPVADEGGAARHDLDEGKRLASRRLESARVGKRSIVYRTNLLDLWPGRVFSLHDHPHPALDESGRLLVTECTMEGAPGEEWTILGRAVFADVPHRPALHTPRPRARIQSATVVGGGEIDPDELGRVRVQFPWERDHERSTWVRVSQAWAGAGYGMMALPRTGQEVLVDFVEGDPEQPMIVGRLFNTTNPVIERLPERATRSAWKSDSGGFNEILFEDEKGSELLYAQAERDERRLVKHDETSTIAHDRRKLVAGDEVETTGRNRVQETKGDRVESTYGDGLTAIDGSRRERVNARGVERIEPDQRGWLGKDQHLITAGTRRELVEHDSHLAVGGSRQESVGGKDSLTVGHGIEESVGSYAVDASGPEGTIHLIAGSPMVLESAAEITVKGAGGFVKISGGEVILFGAEVVVNEGGSPGSLPGPGPDAPERPQAAMVDEPPWPKEMPEPGERW